MNRIQMNIISGILYVVGLCSVFSFCMGVYSIHLTFGLVGVSIGFAIFWSFTGLIAAMLERAMMVGFVQSYIADEITRCIRLGPIKLKRVCFSIAHSVL